MKYSKMWMVWMLALVTVLVGVTQGLAVTAGGGGGVEALAVGGAWGVGVWAVGSWVVTLRVAPGGGVCMPTLTTAEILLDVIDAFTKRLPMLPYMGTDWRPNTLKLGQTYTAHVPTPPSVENITNANYGNLTGATARSLLTDVPVVVNKHKGVKLKFAHLNAIQDNKNEYAKVIGLAGYSLAKALLDDVVATFNPVNFTQHSLFAVADSDADMLDNVCGDLNLVGASPDGRVMVVNTPVANVLAGDSRLTSADYAGQRVRGEGYRRWSAVNGFAEIMEYPDLANTTSGTALTSVSAEADDDTLTASGQVVPATGQAVTVAFASGFTGLTDGSTYYVIRTGATTFKLATTYANAIAGTAINITADGTGATVTPTQTLTAFAMESRAVTLLGGIPDDFNQDFLGLNIPRTMGMEVVTHPDSGITMAAVSWQEVGTGDLYWCPTMVYGLAAGRQAATAAMGGLMDYAGHRVVSA